MTDEPATFTPAVPVPAPGICRECVSLAHYWSQPTEQIIELVDESFSLIQFHCICECGCPALLTTTLPHQPAQGTAK
jgi:hypothetical protein